MKSTLAVLALTLTFSTAAFSADKLVLSIKTQEVLTLKKVSKTKFEKLSQVATGTASLDHVSAKGIKNIGSQDINEANESALTLEVTGKNVLRVIDVKEGINKEVQAEISSSLFGSIKRINISSQTIQGLYAASMKKSGADVLKKLSLFGGALTSTINTSDLNCEADGDLMVCNQKADLILTME